MWTCDDAVDSGRAVREGGSSNHLVTHTVHTRRSAHYILTESGDKKSYERVMNRICITNQAKSAQMECCAPMECDGCSAQTLLGSRVNMSKDDECWNAQWMSQ